MSDTVNNIPSDVSEDVLWGSEKITFALRRKYLSCGYRPYRMSKFEEYDLYAKNKDFLVSDNVITFTDTSGKLMALKPDVTLSLINGSKDDPDVTQKLFYSENVYRVPKGTGSLREIMQTGVECFGKVGEDEICEVVTLAAETLGLLSDEYVLAVSDLGIISALADRLGLSRGGRAALLRAIGERNVHGIEETCADCSDKKTVDLLCRLALTSGKPEEVIRKFSGDLLQGDAGRAFAQLCHMMNLMSGKACYSNVIIDFSVTGDENYYNGIVFKGFLREVPFAVISGGQYDNLMRKLKRRSCAVGFAVYTDLLDRLDPAADQKGDDGYLSVALPKGRLGEKVYGMFAEAGYECPSILEPNRKLVFENAEKRVRYFWVKPSDVAIYVERGAADVGVVGKDILLEYEPDIYELLDLRVGKCKMAVAAPKGYKDDCSGTLRVATKFAGIAKKYYASQGRDIDVIHLNGSIELAPILGLSDVIVDIVETGTTLRENDLEVVDEIVPISARLIANKSAFGFKGKRIEMLKDGLSAVTEGNK